MEFYMAPLEGITSYIYRRAYEHYFHNIDRYFTPFIVNPKLSAKEIRDLSPENNPGMKVIPQIMTNKSDAFLQVSEEINSLGYDEVNLNLGCPSGTVVSKKRGAGFLSVPEKLDAFLAEIFGKSSVKISAKTRIGISDLEEWEPLLAIYKKYPFEELIIHPRLQKDFYKNTPHMEAYTKAYETIKVPLCYNGDIDSVEKFLQFTKKYPQTNRMMFGRGILKYPNLVAEIKQEPLADKETFQQFHNEIYEGYCSIMSGDQNTLYKMKELWPYLGLSFTNPEKYMKKIKKTQHLAEYQIYVKELFREQELVFNSYVNSNSFL
ncbi:MAG TPA: tRNA-dihydrouridine synthase family protein [Lachnospiraceae bacterium]|nr:tRNA-dihydrouridine synthase family protein [Lachnospiraceae bacterium]